MPYSVKIDEVATTGSWDGKRYHLESSGGSEHVILWPAFGFNCVGWQVAREGRLLDLLYADPKLYQDSKPTRSGIPILFPFPNRIRDARFTWDGKNYHFPGNDATGRNAIHGFPCRRPWRVIDHGADGQSAWATGEFQASVDAPEILSAWPADYRLRITYRLLPGRLRQEAEVFNPDTVTLPFGLGFHHYFRTPPYAGYGADCQVRASASSFWELEESLPTGRLLPVDPARNLNDWRRCGDLNLDDVLTSLSAGASDGLCLRGAVRDAAGEVEVRLLTSPAFRELVAFNPAHREAFCLEPYTCTTDAINLQQRGVDAGLLVLPPGETWTGTVELQVS